MSSQQFSPPQPAPAAPTYQLSGWWRRAAALIIDGIVVGVPAMIASVVISLIIYGTVKDAFLSTEFNLADQFFSMLAGLAIAVAYYCMIMPRTNGQTLGKMALDIRVVREDGGEITAGFAFKRQILVIQLLFGYVAALACYIPTFLNYLAPLWDDGNQAWHDKLVNSRVVLAGATAPPLAAQVGGYQDPYAQAPPFPEAPAAPAQPPFPTAPPSSTPPPPQPPGGAIPYTPPPGFDNPVPEEDK